MKYLVETNLLNSTEKDFNSVYTDEVRRGMLAYANGERNSTPQTEQKYVLDKFKESVAELPDEITVLEKYDIAAYIKNGYRQIHVDCKTESNSNSGEEGAPLANIEKAALYIQSDLFRPPHGHMRFPQVLALRKLYRIIMWDVVTRDYSPHLNSDDVFNVVKRYTRNGSIIVFHDSLKAEKNMREAMPRSIEWLLEQGYEFKTL